MDAERYARVRELFLAVDELPSQRQHEFLVDQCGDDQELIDEVKSLLREHDVESARLEGESAKQPAFPASSPETAAVGNPRIPDDSSTIDPSDSVSAANVASPFMPGARISTSSDTTAGDGDSEISKAAERHRKRKAEQSGVRKSEIGARKEIASSAQVTQQSSQRTHASPRYRDERPRPKQRPTTANWQTGSARHQRFNSGWLWLAAVLPTALIGWWIHDRVQTQMRDAAAHELAGMADSVRNSVSLFLDDQARLTESWSRHPELRASIVALADSNENDDSVAALRESKYAMEIRNQLIELTGRKEIKYVVWDRTGKIIASWLADAADIGGSVSPDGAANLARAMRGETVLFGPEILREDGSGFRPETQSPVMAEILPVRDDLGRVVATMLIRGFGMYDALEELCREASRSGGLDVYAVNASGVMVTNSPKAVEWLSGDDAANFSVSCRLRVSDPGESSAQALSLDATTRRTQPLTYAVAGASSGQSGSRVDTYRNYVGTPVVGAWRWINRWDLGIVVERTSESAFATAEIVRIGFVALAIMLTLTQLMAAARIAKRTAVAQAAVHPLSRYELIAELGSGGMGVVYRARHGQLGRDTALKVLRGDRDNLEDRLRFDREAKLAASLSNPHTVTIYDYGRGDEGEAYCVMEFLKGITLYDVVARSGFQPYGRALFILRQICDSLGEAHQLGLVHRDVKPQNVMLSLDASVGDWAVVFDFGLAKPLRPDADSYQTAETIWAGTPMYMAPERYREPNKIDPRSDIYSVGCIAYFLLSGRPPFIECDPESLFALVLTEQPISIGVHRDDDVPAEIEQLVRRCMAKSVDERFSTVDELAHELDRLISVHAWTVEQARMWWRIHGDDLG